MRIAVITQLGEWSASSRYRAIQHMDGLREKLGHVDLLLADDRPGRAPGLVHQAAYWAGHGFRYVRRGIQLAAVLNTYDSVMVQRSAYAVGPGLLSRVFDSFPGTLVYDLDDDLFAMTPSLAGRGALTRWMYGPQQARKLVARADAIVVSSNNLVDALPAPHKSVTVLPTVPDPRLYDLARHSRRVLPIIGWAGTRGGLMYLDTVRPVIEELDRLGAASLRVVSSEPWTGPSHFERWRLSDELQLFAGFDIGIMPLPDTPYTRAKAGFKLLQYMSAGVPVVASPVGINAWLVRESKAGFLADTQDEWREALMRLAGDDELRRRLGENGRAFVENYAALDAQQNILAGLLIASSINA